VHVNPPVTVRARPASVAQGAHQGRYRPIDIDRTPFMIETTRVYGALKVHGTLTCAGKSVNLHRTLPPLISPVVNLCLECSAHSSQNPHANRWVSLDFVPRRGSPEFLSQSACR
jgi:hypothetical protein